MVRGREVEKREGGTYSAINNMLIPRIIVDIYRHSAEGRHFRGEFVEAGIIL
jgi:hypothetical protein